MIVQTITSNYDNQLVERDISIRDMLDHPVSLPKDKVPLWQFYKVTKPFRQMDNYYSIHALILDYDKGIPTIQQFEDKYAELSYALYTTSSHTPDKHRFRVILPLDQEYNYSEMRNKNLKTLLIDHFPGIDHSSFSNFHKIPALPANPNNYYCNINKGSKFSLLQFEDDLLRLHMDEEMDKQFESSKAKKYNLESIEGLQNWYINNHVIPFMESICWSCDGSDRYTQLLSRIGTWSTFAAKSGIDISAIFAVVMGYNLEPKHQKLVRSRLK